MSGFEERLNAPLSMPVEPWLNSRDTVTMIVRDFVREAVLEYYGPDKVRFVNWLANKSFELNRVFLGYEVGEQTGAFHRLPWNTPEQLGMHLVRQYSMIADPNEAVQLIFIQVVDEITDIGDANIGKPLEEWGPEIDEIMDDLILVLLGSIAP